ncbi:membrane-associated tyrosine- and threonine-specific cdc2-inhibitory kinase isoform X2 [Narcine bancroftii]|uniref:membrane-associated tyrosine- and threonine-specific cdc2-inhibitory kinase isoform X2 n=1 Tax=Narcine bancroftii TaxID=1343680 RepID=UPI0038315940
MGEPRLAHTLLPTPAFYKQAEQSFSLRRKSGVPSQSSTPRPPAKSLLPISRVFGRRDLGTRSRPRSVGRSEPGGWPDGLSPGGYDETKGLLYFEQCFEVVSWLGRGSFGEVFKVRWQRDGKLYAVKRSVQPFRGEADRWRRLAEARRHEELGPHPNLVGFVQAWEEGGRLYIQAELCARSLQEEVAARGSPLPEAQVWHCLSDLLAGLGHLHGRGLAHLDVKPANVFRSGPRWKLGDFGLLLEVSGRAEAASEAQEGDPRYMAPELLDGVYGTAADVFSLGMTILEICCNLELPQSGEGWQKLRQGYLPSQFVSGLSLDLLEVLRAMLNPDCWRRPSVKSLLSLPALQRAERWRQGGEVVCTGMGWGLWMGQILLSLISLLWSSLKNLLVNRPPPPPASPPPSAISDSTLYSDWEDSSFGEDVFHIPHRNIPSKTLNLKGKDPGEFSFLSGNVSRFSIGSTSTPQTHSDCSDVRSPLFQLVQIPHGHQSSLH